ncbi:MAG: ATPase [Burkholderiales bacterium]|nr:MAG: ATPase [Burkholderiales bacterium]
MAETTSTRSAALALADERALMRQGYQFLDEKRMLLAAEMLRALADHQALEGRLIEQLRESRAALRGALQRHGLEGLQAYPPAAVSPDAPTLARTQFLGVAQLAAAFEPHIVDAEDTAVDPSPEARACRDAFVALLGPLALLAASTANLERLAAEYRRTERRARALENVLLPEIETALKTIDEHLELADQEEAVRTRLAGRRR